MLRGTDNLYDDIRKHKRVRWEAIKSFSGKSWETQDANAHYMLTVLEIVYKILWMIVLYKWGSISDIEKRWKLGNPSLLQFYRWYWLTQTKRDEQGILFLAEEPPNTSGGAKTSNSSLIQ